MRNFKVRKIVMLNKFIFMLPRQAKLFLTVFGIFILLAFFAACALQMWAQGKVEAGKMLVKEVDVSKTPFAYTARLHFARLDFLLRSQDIANIRIQKVLWDEKVDSASVANIVPRNRSVDFDSPQQLEAQQFLGVAQYSMDFQPLFFTLFKYWLIVFWAVFGGCVLFKGSEQGVVAHFYHQNIASILWQAYCRIPALYRHSFWIIFCITQLTFGFHTVQFLWGNHDWGAVHQYYGLLGDTGLGRYTEILISLGLQDGMVLPFLNNILMFLALSLCAVFLCAFLRVPQKLWIWVTVGLLLTLQPFTFSRLYYAYQAGGLFLAVAIGIFGLILAQKVSAYKTMRGGKPLVLILLATFCLHWAIAAYQVFVDTATVLILGGIIVTILDKKTSLKSAIFEFRFSFVALFLAGLSYKIILDMLKKTGAAPSGYHTTMLPINELPERFLTTIQFAFKELFQYDFPFFPPFTTWLFGSFFLCFVFLLCRTPQNKINKFNILILLILMIIAGQSHMLLSNSITYGPRIDFYGLLFVRVLLVVLVFKISEQFIQKTCLIQNIVFIISAVIIWTFVVQNLYAQRLQKQAFDFELKLLNRVISRIENNENFSYGKNYCGIIFGQVPNMRARLYPNNTGKTYRIAADLLDHRLITEWDPKDAFSYNMPENVFKTCKTFYTEGRMHEPKMQAMLQRLNAAGILENLRPWPHKNSVAVFEDIIVFVASGENLEKIRESVQAPTQNPR